MAGRVRNPKPTDRFGETAVQRLAAASVVEPSVVAPIPVRSIPAEYQDQPTSKIQMENLLELVTHTSPNVVPRNDLLTPELALDLLEQGITTEPPELVQSAEPFAHSIDSTASIDSPPPIDTSGSTSVEIAPDLQVEIRQRTNPQTARLSYEDLAEVAEVAHKIATGEVATVAKPAQAPSVRPAAPPSRRGENWLVLIASLVIFALVAAAAMYLVP